MKHDAVASTFASPHDQRIVDFGIPELYGDNAVGKRLVGTRIALYWVILASSAR